MNCKEFKTITSAYIDNALPPEALLQAEAHGRTCSTCRIHLEEFRSLQQMLGRLEHPSVPTHFKKLVDRQINNEDRKIPLSVLWEVLKTLAYPLRRIEKREILIGLMCLPITLCLFSTILLQMYTRLPYSRTHQVVDLALPSEGLGHQLAGVDQTRQTLKSERALQLTPAKINNGYLLDFVQSIHELPSEDSFAVITYVNKDGQGRIEEIMEYPQEDALLKRFDSLIPAVKFQPAKYNGKAVDSHLILIFNSIMVYS